MPTRVTEDAAKPKFYACSMLPYPSGKLHMGHVRNYTINDMMARQLRMKGLNVLMPMGWDAFGLPAENAAIANHVPPAAVDPRQHRRHEGAMQPLGLSIDWSARLATCDPSLLQVEPVVLPEDAREGRGLQEDAGRQLGPGRPDRAGQRTGRGTAAAGAATPWSSGARSPATTSRSRRYAEELLANVSDPIAPEYLKGWPERVRLMQSHWIGKSQGVRFAFPHRSQMPMARWCRTAGCMSSPPASTR